MTTATATAGLLRPASVERHDAHGLAVRFDDGTVAKAIPAFAAPYHPRPDDRLLVAGEPDATCYAIGVLAHSGPVAWRFAGDAEISARGTLRFRARELDLEAGKLQLTTKRLLARAENWYRWVANTVHDTLRRRRTRVEEDDRLKAERLDLRARGDVSVDGKSINLG